MHGIRQILLEQQVASLGFALEKVFISKDATNVEYESKMARVLTKYKQAGTTSVVFGDIFLKDLREYRENKLAKLDMRGVFPIWKRDTQELTRSFTALGFKAITICGDTNALGRQFVGKLIDEHFLSDLPPTVDTCGENGEYHSYSGDCIPGVMQFKEMMVIVRFEKGDSCCSGNHRSHRHCTRL